MVILRISTVLLLFTEKIENVEKYTVINRNKLQESMGYIIITLAVMLNFEQLKRIIIDNFAQIR